jgi:hypothetical protein
LPGPVVKLVGGGFVWLFCKSMFFMKRWLFFCGLFAAAVRALVKFFLNSMFLAIGEF